MFFVNKPPLFLAFIICQSFFFLSANFAFSSDVDPSDASRGRMLLDFVKMIDGAFQEALDDADLAAQSELESSSYLGRGIPQDSEQALAWTIEAAEQGSSLAQYCLGTAYRKGGSIAQSAQEAMNCYAKSAKQGEARALFIIGEAYEEGKIVVKNYRKAFSCYIKAAKKGDARAQYKVALAYDGTGFNEGIDIDDDDEGYIAKRWYKKSMDQWFLPAVFMCAIYGYRSKWAPK